MSVVIIGLIAALLGFLGSVPLAGPIALLVFTRATQQDYRAAFLVGLGGAVAEGIYAVIATGPKFMLVRASGAIRRDRHSRLGSRLGGFNEGAHDRSVDLSRIEIHHATTAA